MIFTQWGPWAAFGSSCTWALGTSVYSRMTRNHTAFAVNLARSLIAFPIFVVSAFVLAGGVGAGLADFRALSLASTVWFLISTIASYGLGDAVFLMSTESLGVPGALAIASSYPMWTAAAGWAFEGQALDAWQALGLVLTLAGVAAVILFAPSTTEEARGSEGIGEVPIARLRARLPLRGVALALLTSIFWALNGYSVFRGGRGLSMSVANSVRMAFAIGMAPLMARILAPGKPMLLPLTAIRGSFWLFVIEAYGGSAMFVYGLCHSPLAIGATLSALAPVISVPFALALGLERFSLGRTAGVALAALGLRLLVAG